MGKYKSTDIAYCTNQSCPLRSKCYRVPKNLDPNGRYSFSYFESFWNEKEKKYECNYFMSKD